jgi:putative Mg2+ transporter-C (MgtC) family protein
MFLVYGTGDPVTMGAQVVSGIGFLGAGTIIVTRRNQIKGLTTAAGLWSSAGVGLALGVGFYEAALIGGFAVFFVMTLLQRMDNKMHRNAKVLEIYVELSNELSLGDFLQKVRDRDIDVRHTQRDFDGEPEKGVRSFLTTLKLKKRQNHLDVIDQLQQIPGVVYLEEL